MSERLVFVGEAGDGRQVRVEWYPAEPEVVIVTDRPSGFARWSPPIECTTEDA
jgi:hypothetical protein